MDCMEAMREMPDNAFDLAVVDPPYGDGRSQSLNVERESRTPTYNRFGQRFDRYKLSTEADGTERTRTTSGGGGDILPPADVKAKIHRTGGTWAEKFGKKSLRGMWPRNGNTLNSCSASHALR